MTLTDTLKTFAAIPDDKATDDQIHDLLEAARAADEVHPSEWAEIVSLLESKGGIKPQKARSAVTRLKVSKALGCYPHDANEFVPLWLAAFKYTLRFDGQFVRNGVEKDENYIVNEMVNWCSFFAGSQRTPLFSSSLIRGALYNFKSDRSDQILALTYQAVAHDPSADPTQLRRLAELITAPDETQGSHEELIRVTEVAIANFVFRVKNHLRRRWRHSCHLMPILSGPQGSSKTSTIKALLRPVEIVMSSPSFDVLNHDAKQFELARVPVMFFDEMAGASKADVSKLKSLMTAETHEFRQLYQAPVKLPPMFTAIGASNKDISQLIRDETGSRRFVQIKVNSFDPALLSQIDMLAIWRSVDENAEEPPAYASEEVRDLIKRIQAGQKFVGPVQEWALTATASPDDRHRSDVWFADFYLPWLEAHDPGAVRFANSRDFRAELDRLIDSGEVTTFTGSNHSRRRYYRFVGREALQAVKRAAS